MFVFGFLFWLLIAIIIQGIVTCLLIRAGDGTFSLWIAQWIISIALSIITVNAIPVLSIIVIYVLLIFWRAEK